jgi:hypothetical protein
MYTEKFLNSQSKVNKLEVAFNNEPCRDTAKPLSAARVELEKISYNETYTIEFRLAKTNDTIASIRECMINVINN